MHISAAQWGWGYSGRWLVLKTTNTAGNPWIVVPPGENSAVATFDTFEAARAAFAAGHK